jgi:hypothetical protein
MKACIVEDGVVVNTIEVEEGADLSIFGAIDLGVHANIGDTVVDGVLSDAAEREAEFAAAVAQQAIDEAKEKRDELLAATDWWLLSDTAEPTQEQLNYRQALRDLPDQEGFPDVEFPTKP